MKDRKDKMKAHKIEMIGIAIPAILFNYGNFYVFSSFVNGYAPPARHHHLFTLSSSKYISKYQEVVRTKPLFGTYKLEDGDSASDHEAAIDDLRRVEKMFAAAEAALLEAEGVVDTVTVEGIGGKVTQQSDQDLNKIVEMFAEAEAALKEAEAAVAQTSPKGFDVEIPSKKKQISAGSPKEVVSRDNRPAQSLERELVQISPEREKELQKEAAVSAIGGWALGSLVGLALDVYFISVGLDLEIDPGVPPLILGVALGAIGLNVGNKESVAGDVIRSTFGGAAKLVEGFIMGTADNIKAVPEKVQSELQQKAKETARDISSLPSKFKTAASGAAEKAMEETKKEISQIPAKIKQAASGASGNSKGEFWDGNEVGLLRRKLDELSSNFSEVKDDKSLEAKDKLEYVSRAKAEIIARTNKLESEEEKAIANILLQAKKRRVSERLIAEKENFEKEAKIKAETIAKTSDLLDDEKKAVEQILLNAKERAIKENMASSLLSSEAKQRETQEENAVTLAALEAKKKEAEKKRNEGGNIILSGEIEQKARPIIKSLRDTDSNIKPDVNTNEAIVSTSNVLQPRKVSAAPFGVLTLTSWNQNPDGSITGFAGASPAFKGMQITTSPVAPGAEGGTLIGTSSGLRYYLAPNTKQNSVKIPKAPKPPEATQKQKTEFKKPAQDIAKKKIVKTISSSERDTKLQLLNSIKSASKETKTEVGTRSKLNIGLSDTDKRRAQASPSPSPIPRTVPPAPEGLKTISEWSQNPDGTISGYISSPGIFGNRKTITTTPLISRSAREGAVVETVSGSRYYLGLTDEKYFQYLESSKKKVEESKRTIILQRTIALFGLAASATLFGTGSVLPTADFGQPFQNSLLNAATYKDAEKSREGTETYYSSEERRQKAMEEIESKLFKTEDLPVEKKNSVEKDMVDQTNSQEDLNDPNALDTESSSSNSNFSETVDSPVEEVTDTKVDILDPVVSNKADEENNLMQKSEIVEKKLPMVNFEAESKVMDQGVARNSKAKGVETIRKIGAGLVASSAITLGLYTLTQRTNASFEEEQFTVDLEIKGREEVRMETSNGKLKESQGETIGNMEINNPPTKIVENSTFAEKYTFPEQKFDGVAASEAKSTDYSDQWTAALKSTEEDKSDG